jgi:hypothetical protein
VSSEPPRFGHRRSCHPRRQRQEPDPGRKGHRSPSHAGRTT